MLFRFVLYIVIGMWLFPLGGNLQTSEQSHEWGKEYGNH